MKKISLRVRNFEKERFLTYNIDNEATLDDEILDFLEDEEPQGVVPVIFEEGEEFDTFSYDITEKIPLSELSTQEINSEMALNIIHSLILALIDITEYRIPLSYLVLNRSYIYVDSDYKIEFVCIPLEDMQENMDINAFIRGFLANIRYDLSENCHYVARLLTYVNNTAMFNMRNMVTLVEELMDDMGVEIKVDDSAEIYVDYQEVDEQGDTEVEEPEEEEISEIAEELEEAVDDSEENAEEIEEDEAVDEDDEDEKEAEVEDETADEEEDSIEEENEKDIEEVEDIKIVEETKEKKEAPKEAAAPVQNEKVEELELMMDDVEEKKESNTADVFSVEEAEEAFGTSSKEAAVTKEEEVKKASFKTKEAKSVVIDDDFDDFVAEKEKLEKQSKESSIKFKKDIKVNRASVVKKSQEEDLTVEPEEEKPEETPVAEVDDTANTSILSQALGMTGILQGSNVPKANPYLVRTNTEERVMITKQNFKIGKAAMGVDYTIRGNGAISRSHAIIINKDGVYYIKDNKSTNHTYVNNKMVAEGQAELLVHDCKIVLGDEEFTFKLR